MNTPKAQFQIDNGSGWQTVAEVDIIDGIVEPPAAWTMVRALHKRISYTGELPIQLTVAPSNPRDTHFAGFAKSIVEELFKLDFWIESGPGVYDIRQDFADILARRAYDLVVHALTILDRPEYIIDIPDLTELPKEE